MGKESVGTLGQESDTCRSLMESKVKVITRARHTMHLKDPHICGQGSGDNVASKEAREPCRRAGGRKAGQWLARAPARVEALRPTRQQAREREPPAQKKTWSKSAERKIPGIPTTVTKRHRSLDISVLSSCAL